MCQYIAKDGFPSDWHVAHLGSRAIGGASLVFAEATGVEPEGRITHGCAGIWKDEHIPAWKRVTDAISSNGAIPGLQIAHAGRKGRTLLPWENNGASLDASQGKWDTIAPSPIPFGANITHIPKEATLEDLARIKQKFVDASRRALLAGFKVLEIHGAHGYLIDEFISPLCNKRTDQYGGSLDNRLRLLVEICQGVRKVWPSDLPLFVRLSCSDWADGGKTIDDTVYISKKLKEVGVDLIDASSGFATPESFKNIKFGPGFQVPFAEKIKKEANILTAAIGGITSGKQANEILEKNQADFILAATHFLRDPFFTYHAALELNFPPKDAASLLPVQTGFWLQKSRLSQLEAKL